MKLFKKKKTYLLTWAYDSDTNIHHTDIFKAYDMADAWKKHRKGHNLPTYLISIKEIE